MIWRFMTPRRESRASGVAFLAAAATLFTQILVHRMVSAKLLNNYAFLVISLTMLGFALSGVLLTRVQPWFTARRNEAMSLCAAAFAVTLLGAAALFYHADTASSLDEDRVLYLATVFRRLPLALPLAVPFVPCGLMLGALLSDRSLSTRRIYAFDLAGSAAGALLVIPAVGSFGVEPSLLAGAFVLAAGTWILLPPHGGLARGALVSALLLLVAAGAARDRVFDMRYPKGSFLALAKAGEDGMALEYVAWDPVARIEMTRIPPPDPATNPYPSLIGPNREFHSRFERVLTQNNFAFTYAVRYDGRQETLRGIEETLYAAAYQAAAPHPRVAIIGVGGGFDVLTALRFEAARITAVEVNAATVALFEGAYADYFRAWVRDPRVQIIHDEGRHHLASSPERFDVLQLSGVDSYSGTPGAAHVFSESYLYTTEAMDLYLSRLAEGGILNMMRLEHHPPREMLRALATAVEALRRAGSPHPWRHIVVVTATNGAFTALLVKKTPFTGTEEEALARWAARSPYFRISASPTSPASTGSVYKHFLSLDDPAKERAFAAAYPFDIAPVTDDRPFFFRHSRWGHLLTDDPAFRRTPPVTELSLLALLVVVGSAAVLCVYLPLRWLLSRRVTVAGKGRYGVFFGCIALGYLAVEIALLQKFGLFLGHPNHALSVVLAALLLSTGLGALSSRSIVAALGGLRFVTYAIALVILLEYFLVYPRLAGWLTLPFPVRTLLTVVWVAPFGLLLGTFVPSALDQVKSAGAEFAPWAWGVNGVFSVLAPILAIAVSMTWGMNALLLGAIPVYLLAAMVLPAPAKEDAALVSEAAPAATA